ncbi:hypothetical protein CDV57_09736, partial [Aspergillus fumigatus]
YGTSVDSHANSYLEKETIESLRTDDGARSWPISAVRYTVLPIPSDAVTPAEAQANAGLIPPNGRCRIRGKWLNSRARKLKFAHLSTSLQV